ncbi:MAG: adenylate/guanylate cyclase domain-containing protein [Planctomycetota bacterium]
MGLRKISLRITIGSFISLLLLCTGLAVLWVISTDSKKTLLETSGQIMEQVENAVQGEMRAYLRGTQATVFNAVNHSNMGVINPADSRSLEAYFYSLLSGPTPIQGLLYGDFEGRFIMVVRKPDGALDTKEVGGDIKGALWRRRKPGGALAHFRTETDLLDRYDPRTRPWYMHWSGATSEMLDKPTAFWTDAYIFHTEQTPGITVSLPHVVGGQLRGVFSADIPLIHLSRFLGDLKVGKNGRVVVTDSQDRLLAVGDPKDLLVAGPDGKSTLRAMVDAPYPEVAELARLGRVEDEGGRFTLGGVTYLSSWNPMDEGVVSCRTAITVPEDDFLGSVKESMVRAVTIVAALIAISLLIGMQFTNILSRSLRRLVTEAKDIEQLNFSSHPGKPSRFREIHDVLMAFDRMKVGLRSFGKFVPGKLVQMLLAKGVEPQLGAEGRELTILFSDIRNFTPISEQMGVAKLSEKLGAYMSTVTNIIQGPRSQGIVDKYVGDCVMALWNAPEQVEDHSLKACLATLECVRALERLQDAFPGTPEFVTRFGIHTGTVMVGNFGSKERLDYTCIGDGVNLASRLEHINKYYSTQIIISESVHERVKDKLETRLVDLVAVKGKVEGVRIYELLGEKGSVSEAILGFRNRYEEAMTRYLAHDFAAARSHWVALRHERPGDLSVSSMIERCDEYLEHPPGEAWNGVHVMQGK